MKKTSTEPKAPKDWKFITVVALLVINIATVVWLTYSNQALLQFTMQFVTDVFYTSSGIDPAPTDHDSSSSQSSTDDTLYSEPGTYYNDDGSIVDVQQDDGGTSNETSNVG